MLVRDGEIVPSLGVSGVELNRALPAVLGLPPETSLRHFYPEFHLLLRGVPILRGRGRSQQNDGEQKHRGSRAHGCLGSL